jgi:hypothetical protein
VIRALVLTAGFFLAAVYSTFSALPARANESATVNAKVTVASPCLTVSFTNPSATGLDFGTLAFGSGAGQGNFFSVTNCSTAQESISARGTDATSSTSTAAWTLDDTFFGGPTCSTTPSTNKYALDTNFAGQTGVVRLSKSDKLVQAIAPGPTSVHVSVAMPCSGSAGAGETMNFQFVYTASF